jgi:molybdopterin/thiamine biosynthesis adenylyltransferase
MPVFIFDAGSAMLESMITAQCSMNDQQLLRYSRHILLDEVGIEGQQAWLNAKVLIVGLGGLGSPAALYLAASGVGHLMLCDHDTVELSNLQRQIIHRTSAIGQPKVVSAHAVLRDINPDVQCVALTARADETLLAQQVKLADVVLDCSDNFATRYAVNRACYRYRKPLVSGAAIQFDGQVAVFDFRHEDAACYNCIFPEDAAAAELRCATTGVFAPLVGIIGAMQAVEALKLLAGMRQGLSGQLFTCNALDMLTQRSRVHRDPACKVCGDGELTKE